MSLFKKASQNPLITSIVAIPVIAGLIVTLVVLTQGTGPVYQGVIIDHDPAFDNLISAYTSGEISKKSPIRVRFLDKCVETDELNNEVDNPFNFTPAIDGSAKWIDTRTIEFYPNDLLPQNTVYLAKLDLNDIIENVPDSLRRFEFQFKTIPQGFDISIGGLNCIDETKLKWQQVIGTVTTEDYESEKNIESLITAIQDDNNLKITWNHDDNSLTHAFVIDSIARKESKSKVKLSWDGKHMGVDQTGERSIKVNALGDFNFISTYSYSNPEQFIVVEFSDPLDREQNLKGLITLQNKQFDFVVDGNKIKIYPKNRLTGTLDIKIAAGIKNILGYKTKKAIEDQITFTEIKPEVQMIGKGNIIPMGGQLPFAFKTVSLNAVDIRVIQIVEKNIPQFLQVNNLNGSQEMKRVGKVLINKKIKLDQTKDLGTWCEHAVDLSSMIKPEPGAIYEVSIGFRQSYSLYGCAKETDEGRIEGMAAMEEKGMLGIGEEWNGPGYHSGRSNWDYWQYGYDYSDQNDPCTPAYYHNRRAKKRNILASSIGVLAKRGTNNELFVTVNDLNSTDPLAGAEIEIYDFQQQLMNKSRTDANGFVTLPLSKTPFLLVAKKGNERGYLRLDNGNSLSLSRFDVSGQKYHKGIKGFWYGERGVWRPGDSLFLTFILEDKLGSLPTGHPVTFEFRNPMNQLVKREVRSKALNGFYAFPVLTSEDDKTGNYSVTAKVGGATFSKSLSIETIVPNRLKIQMDFGADYMSNSQESKSTTLKSTWLHGATADNLKAEITAVLSQSSTKFKTFTDFTFDDPTGSFESEESVIFQGRLDENGEAEIDAEISTNENSPGMLMAHFKTKVFEPGGGFSVDRFSLPYHPYDTYVGLKLPKGDKSRGMLLTDTNHTVNLVTLDPDGKKAPNKKLTISLYKMSWRWWWESNNSGSSYNGVNYKEPLQTTSLRTGSDGQAEWKLKVKYPDWGRYLVRVCDEDGHCSGKIVYIDWPGWAGRAQKDNPAGAKMLTFTSDKPNYTIGEDIILNIPTGAEGRALVSIESGTQVIDAYWAEANKGTTKFKFKATRAMSPNVYVNVTYLQPHAQTKNDLPQRMYGVIPVKVEDPATHITPQLSMPEVLRPNNTSEIVVSEKNGKAMTYTLAVVDEGLLDLTRFKTPSPWNHFYQRTALGVKTWDMYDDVIGADYTQFKNLLSIGGGSGLDDGGNGAKQNRFKPMVRFMGPYFINDGETKKHKIDIPNYIGSVRTMVVAGYDGAYGHTDKTTPVKDPLMVLGTLPRVLGPNEELDFPVTVFAMEKKIKDVKVQLSVTGLIDVDDDLTKTLTFDKVGDQLVNFRIKVRPQVGQAKVKVTVIAAGEKATYETAIDIRNPNPEVTDLYEGVISNGGEWTTNFTPVGMQGTNKARLEVSSIPPLNLQKRLDYLIRYPYGCVEQTTSSVFPQLYLSSLIKLSEKDKTRIDRNIQMGISRLMNFQVANGGLAYWPGNGEVNNWGTNYAGHFLIEAKKAGYHVNDEFMNNWKTYQKNQANAWSSSNRSEQMYQAYRLYLLSLADSPELGAMNRLRNISSRSTIVSYFLAAAYHLAGQPEIASELTSGLSFTLKEYKELSGTYGSNLRDKGILLLMLAEMNKKQKGKELIKEISDKVKTNNWYSTQTTAYCLIGVAKFVGVAGNPGETKFRYKTGNGSWVTVNAKSAIWQTEYDINSLEEQSLEIENNNNSMIFAQLLVEGIPAEGDQSDAANNLNISVVYKDVSGAEVNPTQLEQGKDFKAFVTVSNPSNRRYEEMVLNQVFPSGWEIHNGRMDSGSSLNNGSIPEYQDIRDDRVYTFFDLGARASKTFVIGLNASYQGKYYLPTVEAEAMYDKSIHARKHGRWITVEN